MSYKIMKGTEAEVLRLSGTKLQVLCTQNGFGPDIWKDHESERMCWKHDDYRISIPETEKIDPKDQIIRELKDANRKLRILARCATISLVIAGGDEAIDAAELNPWCINEGRATGDEKISLRHIRTSEEIENHYNGEIEE